MEHTRESEAPPKRQLGPPQRTPRAPRPRWAACGCVWVLVRRGRGGQGEDTHQVHNTLGKAFGPRGQGMDIKLGTAGSGDEAASRRSQQQGVRTAPSLTGTNTGASAHALEAVAGQATPDGCPLQLREHGVNCGAGGGGATKTAAPPPFLCFSSVEHKPHSQSTMGGGRGYAGYVPAKIADVRVWLRCAASLQQWGDLLPALGALTPACVALQVLTAPMDLAMKKITNPATFETIKKARHRVLKRQPLLVCPRPRLLPLDLTPACLARPACPATR